MQITVQITGLEQLQSGLQNIEAGLRDPSGLLLDAGYIVEAQAKINASGRPGPNVITGNLRGSIVTSLASPISALVGVGALYAPYVELGHAQQVGRYVPQIGKRLVNPRAPAYPFFFQSIEQTRDKIQALVSQWVNNLLERIK